MKAAVPAQPSKSTLSVSELFEQWQADNLAAAVSPFRPLRPEIERRIADVEREIGRVPSRTISEIVLKVRVLTALDQLRREDGRTLVQGVLEDLTLLERFGEVEDLPST